MISSSIRILLIIFSLTLFFIIMYFIRKNKIPIRYSLFWITSAILLLFVGVFPKIVGILTSIVGFETTSNFVIGIILVLLLIITLILTVIVSGQKKKIKLLIQEVSLLKNELNNLNKRKGK